MNQKSYWRDCILGSLGGAFLMLANMAWIGRQWKKTEESKDE